MNGILIPWPIVLLAVTYGAAWTVRYLFAANRPNRMGLGTIGTMSFSVGIATFTFLMLTLLSKTTFAALAEKSSPADKIDVKETSSPDQAEQEKTSKSISSAKSPSTAESPSPTSPEKLSSESAAAKAELESPISTVKIDWEKRPSWVEAPEQQTGDVHLVSIASGPWATQSECDRALNSRLIQATNEYIREFLHSDLAPQKLHYDLAYIKKHLVKEKGTYHETLTVSFGQMKQSHALLQFDGSFRHELETRWRRVIAASRLGQTGLVFGSLLALLGTFFGYYKLDHATRGFYAGRLQLGMAAVILTLVAAGIALAVLITWS